MEHRDYSGAIRFLADRKIPHGQIARLFDKAEKSIPVIAWREANGLIPREVEKVLGETNSAGLDADRLLKNARVKEVYIEEPSSITDLEARIDAFGQRFWQKVKDGKGVKELGLLLRRVSRPSPENIPLRRASAHLYHLLAETYLHAGFCRSALVFAAKAYRAEAVLYKETLSRNELFRIAKTSLLISQSFINRSQYDSALPWIARSTDAFKAGSLPIDPESYKQLGNIQLHKNFLDSAAKNFAKAGSLLGSFEPRSTLAHIKDIGERHLNLAAKTVKWENSFELMEFALRSWPKDDIHKALNVNWAAAAGFMTDSDEANKRAFDLLHIKGHLSKGYQHPETVTKLLLMTPELPRALRPAWAQFSLHYNAFRNK